MLEIKQIKHRRVLGSMFVTTIDVVCYSTEKYVLGSVFVGEKFVGMLTDIVYGYEGDLNKYEIRKLYGDLDVCSIEVGEKITLSDVEEDINAARENFTEYSVRRRHHLIIR